jgi:hypothetical protein
MLPFPVRGFSEWNSRLAWHPRGSTSWDSSQVSVNDAPPSRLMETTRWLSSSFWLRQLSIRSPLLNSTAVASEVLSRGTLPPIRQVSPLSSEWMTCANMCVPCALWRAGTTTRPLCGSLRFTIAWQGPVPYHPQSLS